MPPRPPNGHLYPEPAMKSWRRTRSATLASYRVFDVLRHEVADGKGNPRGDFFTLACPDWCNVLAVTARDQVVFIWQYRFGTDQLGLELPGGVIEAGETPGDAAARELREETGYVAAAITPLLATQPNPALQGNTCFGFVAEGATLAGPPRFDDAEECEVALVDADDLPELLDSGTVHHALHVALLETYLRKRRTYVR